MDRVKGLKSMSLIVACLLSASVSRSSAKGLRRAGRSRNPAAVYVNRSRASMIADFFHIAGHHQALLFILLYRLTGKESKEVMRDFPV